MGTKRSSLRSHLLKVSIVLCIKDLGDAYGCGMMYDVWVWYEMRMGDFVSRSYITWNNLPADIVNSISPGVFSKAIKKVNRTTVVPRSYITD